MKTITLQNGRTKVPAKNNAYKNKMKSDNSLLKIVDINVVYEKFNKHYNVLQRLDTNVETKVYGVYRFYPNGKFNKFFIDKRDVFNKNDFNPRYNGYRGVYYWDKNQIRYDLFAESNELGWIGKLTGTFTFSGDTLYVKRDVDKTHIDIYIKRKLPPSYLDHKADW